MDDTEAVAAIERRHELELLDRLLEERSRPVPAPPKPPPKRRRDQAQRQELIDLMQLIAEVLRSPHSFRAVVVT